MTQIILPNVTPIDASLVPTSQNPKDFARLADTFNGMTVPRFSNELAALVPELAKLISGLHLTVALDAWSNATTYNFPDAVATSEGPRYCIGVNVYDDNPVGSTTGNWLNPYQLSTAVMAAYATLASPAFTGIPTCPTAAPGTNNNQIASTAFARQISDSLVAAITAGLNAKQNSLGFTPIQQGTGVGQLANAVKVGWSGARVKCTVDSSDMGNLVTDAYLDYWMRGSAGVNGYQCYKNGTFRQWGLSYYTASAQVAQVVYFPIAFAAAYNIRLTPYGITRFWVTDLQPSYFQYALDYTGSGPTYWEAIGYLAAQ